MTPREIFDKLEKRRRDLRMSYATLAERAGVSMPTVVRALSGRHPQTSFANVFASSGAVCVAATMLFGLVPAILTARIDVAERFSGIEKEVDLLDGEVLDSEQVFAFERHAF